MCLQSNNFSDYMQLQVGGPPNNESFQFQRLFFSLGKAMGCLSQEKLQHLQHQCLMFVPSFASVFDFENAKPFWDI